jgi:uncharacterized protein involved in exopolysaccharide biosynthesis
MDRPSSEPTSDLQSSDVDRDRVIWVVARDVLSLAHQDADSTAFIESVWKGRWLVLAFVVGFTLLATAYALLAREWYTAEAVLMPAGTKSTQAGGLTAQLENIGVLAGLAAGALGSPRTAEPIGVLKSRDFARQFIEEQGLLHVLLADKWDASRGRWKESDPRRQPDMRDAIEYFDKHVLLVNEDKKTGLITVGTQWKDPSVAAFWTNTIVDRLNDQMRTRVLTEGEANVAYLEKELAETNVVEMKLALSRILETELQKVMVARGDKQYAFRVVDHADVPKWRSWPKRKVIVAVGILAGGLAGLVAVFVREYLARRPLAPE